MSYTADDLKRERIEQLRHLATVQKVDGMLIQEWEIVALCDLALREQDRRYEDLEHEHLGCPVAKTGIYAKAIEFKGRADDAGSLARAILELPQYVSREPIAWAVYDEGNDELLGAVILKPENEDTAGLRYEPLYISGESSK